MPVIPQRAAGATACRRAIPRGVNTSEEIHEWARREAARRRPFTESAVRQLVLLARELDNRSDGEAA